MKTFRVLAFSIAAFGAMQSGRALALAPVCIHAGDSAGLTAALANAADTSTGTFIEVEQGTYIVPASGWVFQFAPGVDVSLLGGYLPNTNCQSRHITASPLTASTNTILDAQNAAGSAIVFAAQLDNPGNLPFGTLTVEGFEIRNLQATTAGQSGLFATFDVQDGRTGGIVFRYNWVHNAVSAGAVVELHTGGAMTVTNNLIDKNIGAQAMYLLSASYNGAPWRIVNNTVANNTGDGLAIDQGGTYVQSFNNIFYANSSHDLSVAGAYVELHGDTYGNATVSNGGSINNHGFAFANVNPSYDTTTFHLTAGSNSINSGAGFAGVLPQQDLDGNPRWQGSNPDRGAFETNLSDQAYWLVTAAGDGSHATDASVNCNPGSVSCTLRGAITRANVAGASIIAFNLGSSCGPHAIALSSALPAINVPLLIDGFTQPGSLRNDVDLQVDAALDEKLCVVVEGVVADHLASALVVGSSNFGAQLEVRGLTFEAFTGAPISIAQGSYHWIHGNSFGIETDASPFVIANGQGVSLGAGATFSTIGGFNAGDVNLFGSMSATSHAVLTIGSTPNGHIGHIVAGNILGLVPGTAVKANLGGGILLQNTSFNELALNTVVASALDGIDIVNANSNWLHDNFIGSAPQYGIAYVSSYSNGGSGIAISGASANNHLGAFDAAGGKLGTSNEILNNKGPGVWIKTGAGAGNSVLDNYIGLNGPNSGGDFGIDYGPLGTSDGGGVATIGITQSYSLATSGILDANFIVTGTGSTLYRADFYNSVGACDASGYGPAEVPLQTYFFSMQGSGFVVQSFSLQLPVGAIYSWPAHITAAITDMTTQTTTQISNCAIVLNDQVFIDGFEPANIAF